MTRLLLAAALVAGSAALVGGGTASAACEPNPVFGEFCPGTFTGGLTDRLEDEFEIVPPCRPNC